MWNNCKVLHFVVDYPQPVDCLESIPSWIFCGVCSRACMIWWFRFFHILERHGPTLDIHLYRHQTEFVDRGSSIVYPERELKISSNGNRYPNKRETTHLLNSIRASAMCALVRVSWARLSSANERELISVRTKVNANSENSEEPKRVLGCERKLEPQKVNINYSAHWT